MSPLIFPIWPHSNISCAKERLENAEERMNFEIEKQIVAEEGELFDENGNTISHLVAVCAFTACDC